MRRALFLDRDGVINVEKNYVHRVEDFEFVDGIFDLCARAQELGFKLVVITNQAGIGRGYYAEADYQRLNEWMLQEFAARGIRIARVYHCPYHPTTGIGDYRRESFDRKPNPGMILQAQRDLDLDLSKSVLVGDKDSDLEAGQAAGVGHNLKVIHEGVADSDQQEFASLFAIRDWLGRNFSRSSIKTAATNADSNVKTKTVVSRRARKGAEKS